MRKEVVINGVDTFYEAREEGDSIIIQISGKDFSFSNTSVENGKIFFDLNGSKEHLYVGSHDQQTFCDLDGKYFNIKRREKSFSKSDVESDAGLVSPMPGKIIKINFSAGDMVNKGDPIVVMEAMKMEHTLIAGKDGELLAINCAEGDLVEGGVTLVELGDSNDS